jgi:hypothetical protein
MRLAMLAPMAWRTPPRHYGPWGQVVANEAVAVLGKLDTLERKACRADVEARFSSARMVAAYAAVYDHILGGQR